MKFRSHWFRIALNILLFLLIVLLIWSFWNWFDECSAEPWNLILISIIPFLWGIRADGNLAKIKQIVIVGFLLFAMFILLWFYVNNTVCSGKVPPSVAVEFLLDTSDNMKDDVRGIPRYQIAVNAIGEITYQLRNINASQVWRGIRTAGGTSCEQTEQISSGRFISDSVFLEPLTNINFNNETNAYQAGLQKTASDLHSLSPDADVKIAILMLGSIDSSPCSKFDWVEQLETIRDSGIDATMCVFTLNIDDSIYTNFSADLSQNGFACVHNVTNPGEISRISVGLLEELIRIEQGETETVLTQVPVQPPATPSRLPVNTPAVTSTAQTREILEEPTPEAETTFTPEPTQVSLPAASGGRTAACRFVIDQPIRATLHDDIENTQRDFRIDVLTVIQLLGITPDRERWIFQPAEGSPVSNIYYYPVEGEPPITDDSDADVFTLPVPDDCNYPAWGVPENNFASLDAILEQVNATAWTEQYTGDEIVIAVLDPDFTGLDQFLSQSSATIERLPLATEADTAGIDIAGSNQDSHGVRLLQILTDIAPDATYLTAETRSVEQIVTATDLLFAPEENDLPQVDIILHTAGIITAPDDPQLATYRELVQAAVEEHDIFWINAAGNIGAGYYRAQYNPQPSNLGLIHSFADFSRIGFFQRSLMVPVYEETGTTVHLVWNATANPDGRNDFDLRIYPGPILGGSFQTGRGGSINVWSLTEQRNNDDVLGIEKDRISSPGIQFIGDRIAIPEHPYAGLTTRQDVERNIVDDIDDNEIYILIEDRDTEEIPLSAPGTWFELYVENALPAEYDPHISVSLAPVVLPPADNPYSFTVGSYNPSTNRMAWYSSRFNLHQYQDLYNSEFIKPDVAAPGEIILDDSRYRGTGYSAAITGGIAALLMEHQQANEGAVNIDELRNFLSQQAITCLNDGAVGNRIGRLQLPDDVSPLSAIETIDCGTNPDYANFDTSRVEIYTVDELQAFSQP